ncbi:MAG: dephospho-CoA kinase [Rhodocyclaceae bacterium]
MTFIVGLTGGIGSGKTTVADLFAERGAVLVDTDVIAHQLTTAQGAAMPAIRAAFGDVLLAADGSLDRAGMRRLVFSNPSAKVRLEAILHPLIRAESAARCAAATGAPYVLLVVPLLLESGDYRQRVDRILVVDCAEALQVSRTMARSKLSAEDVWAIIAAQASRAERRAAADDLLLNDDGREPLLAQVETLHHRYLELAAA